MNRKLDIIVPIYRNAPLVRVCIESLLAHLSEISDRDPRMFLINDSPDDGPTADLLGERQFQRADVILLKNEQNVGFVRSVNLGLAMARAAGHDVLLVNSDTQTFPGTMKRLLEAAAADPQIGFASPRSNNASICSLPHFFGGEDADSPACYERWKAISRTMPAWHFTPTAVGFYIFIAHSVLANHGCLKEDFGKGYEEENDLVLRAGKVGQRAIVVNDAFAYHAGGVSFALSDLGDIAQHKHQNLLKLTRMHPEFLPLVRRYEASPHFRAERLMSGMVPDGQGRLKLVFDLTGLGQHHNGTNEHAVAVVRSIARRWSHRFRIAGVGTQQSFQFHGLDKVPGLFREEPEAPGIHTVAIRIAQPYQPQQVALMERMAPINIYAMLDTISEDCGPLAVEGVFQDLWKHVSVHANGLLFNSRSAERQFLCRHAAAHKLPRMARLLSTQCNDYRSTAPTSGGTNSHVLILGNHFPHKAVEPTADRLRAAFPHLTFVAVGASTFQEGNLTCFRSGSLDAELVAALISNASAVVLPSHLEGFGFGLMHALAAGRPVVARSIPATQEILNSFDGIRGVELFDTDPELPVALKKALAAKESSVEEARTVNWEEWADCTAEFALQLAESSDAFEKLVERISASDMLRAKLVADASVSDATRPPAVDVPAPAPLGLDALLALEGRSFLEHAYSTLLRRPIDEGGMDFYLSELNNGTEKLQILHALSISPEGRERGVELEGYSEKVQNLIDRPIPVSAPSPTSVELENRSTIKELLTLKDEAFVRAAYLTILDREVDKSGFDFYLAELRSGVEKAEILRTLLASEEGLARGVDLDAASMLFNASEKCGRLNWLKAFKR
jgi:GT2 family glycosyltransferase